MNYYDEIAEGYDELHAEEQQKKLAVVKQHLKQYIELNNNTTILDIGCGTGESSNFECKVEGIDPSEKLVEKAREKFPKHHFKAIKAEEFKFEKHYDIIISLTAMHHVENRAELFKSIQAHTSLFICSLLKKSSQTNTIRKELEIFTLQETVEEDKDIIMFLKS